MKKLLMKKLLGKRGITMLEILITLALTSLVLTGIGAGIVSAGSHLSTSRRIMNAEAMADQLQMLILADLRVAQPAKRSNSVIYYPDGNTNSSNIGGYKYDYVSGTSSTGNENVIRTSNSPTDGGVNSTTNVTQIKYRASVLATATHTIGTTKRTFVTLTDGSKRYEDILPPDSTLASKLTKYNINKTQTNGQDKGTFHFEVGFEVFDDQGTLVKREFNVYPLVNTYDLTTASTTPTP